MARLAAHHHHVAGAVGHGIRQALVGMQLAAVLVQLRHQQPLPQLHIAFLRLQVADQQLEQRGLARAIGAHQRDAVAAVDAQGKILHNLAVAIAKGDPLGVNHLGAAARTFGGFHFHSAQAFDLFAAVLAHAAQPLQPADIALAPGGDAVPDPMFFLGDAAFQLVALGLFLFQHLVAPRFEGCEGFFQPVGAAPVQPDGDARQIFQEAAVMADQHQRAATGFQFAFQPFNGGDVQVIGRLIQQQDVGPGRQGAGQRRAPRFAARQGGGIFRAVQTQMAEQVIGAVGIVMQIQPRLDEFAGGSKARHVGFLRQVAHDGAGLDKHRAAVGFRQAGRDLHQGGLARAVAPHQADAVSHLDAEIGAVEQLLAAKGDGNVLQVQYGRHGALCAAPDAVNQAQTSGFWP